MKRLFNNGAYFISIDAAGYVRIGNVTGAIFELTPKHRLYATIVCARQADEVGMLYKTLKDEYQT